ncbi:hypothetical protein GCM10010172_04950 [Paractinoplanes ferrugineus]|uniref:Uncharacterized protein n=1 Tax=Paractinoplanes ferrugineus TaxID=113564 RepID=A0A919MEB3_9ACTN|nr:hypothetical protein [Actinoplanes ferrugineus]GIE12588.1 hypothetical protein Afe05nite_44280 [Actinoplanes ferrugineus]
MDKPLEFLDLRRRLVGERPVAFTASPSPEWALSDLRRRLGSARRDWSTKAPSHPWSCPCGRGPRGWPHRRGSYRSWCAKSTRIAGRRGVRSGRR